MTGRSLTAAILVLGLAPAASCGGGGDTAESGGIAFINGSDCTVTKPDGTSFNCTETTPEGGDRIKTGGDTQIWVAIQKAVRFNMGGGSELAIEALSEPVSDVSMLASGSSSTASSTRLRLNRGSAWSQINRSGAGNIRYSVSTSSATASARGTEFATVIMENGESMFCTCKGEIEVMGSSNRFSVPAGMGTLVTPEGVVAEPREEIDFILEPDLDDRFSSCMECHISGTRDVRSEVMNPGSGGGGDDWGDY